MEVFKNLKEMNVKRDIAENIIMKIQESFAPKFLVVANKEAKTLLHKNKLTPAEFLMPFCKKLKYSQKSQQNLNTDSDAEAPIEARYSSIRLVDLEEWVSLDSGDSGDPLPILDELFGNFLKNIEPKTQELERKLDEDKDKIKEKEKDESKDKNKEKEVYPYIRTDLLNIYGWDQALELFGFYLSSIGKEYEFTNMNHCIGVIEIIHFNEKEKPDLVTALETLESQERSRIIKALGGADFNHKTLRIIIVIGENVSPNTIDTKKEAIKSTYKDSILSTIIIAYRDQKDAPNNWTKDIQFPHKRKILSYEVNEEKTDSNTPGLERGENLNSETISQAKNAMLNVFGNELKFKLENTVRFLQKRASDMKKTVKKGFLGLFRKEEKIYTTNDGKYKLTDVEREVKLYADYLMYIGMYAEAFKEYDYILDNLGKVALQ